MKVCLRVGVDVKPGLHTRNILSCQVVLRSEIDVLVFHLEAQAGRKRMLQAAADDIAYLRTANVIKGRKATRIPKRKAVLDPAPGKPCRCVKQRPIPGKANAGTEGSEPVDLI